MSVMTKAGRDRARRYHGGGTSGCHMSCDYMTPKQLKELNGEVHTYQMNKPVRWAEFKQYPVEFQQEYIDNLTREYNVNYTSLSEMLGVGTSSVKRLIEKNQLSVSFSVGHGMNGEQRKAWKRFLTQEPAEPEVSEPEPTEPEPAEQPAPTAVMTQFSISFCGRIDPAAIANSLTQMLGKDAEGTIRLEFSLDAPHLP